MVSRCPHGRRIQDSIYECPLCYDRRTEELNAMEAAERDRERDRKAAERNREQTGLLKEIASQSRSEGSSAQSKMIQSQELSRYAEERCKIGDYSGAVELIDQAIENTPDFVPFYKQRAKYYVLQGKKGEAISDFRFLFERDREYLIEANYQIKSNSLGDFGSLEPDLKSLIRELEQKEEAAIKSKNKKKTDEHLQKAMKAVSNATKGIQKLKELQRQLNTYYDPEEKLKMAIAKLSESRRSYNLDTNPGYMQSQGNAKKALGLANELNKDISELQKAEEKAQKEIDMTRSALEKVEGDSEEAGKKLEKAVEAFELGTREGYSRAYKFAHESHIQAKQVAELIQQRKEAQSALANADTVLRRICTAQKGKYVQHEVRQVNRNLVEAHAKFKLETRQGYIEAARIANSEAEKISSLADKREFEHREETAKSVAGIGSGLLFGIGFAIAGVLIGGISGCCVTGIFTGNMDAGLIAGAIIGGVIGLVSGIVKGWSTGHKEGW